MIEDRITTTIAAGAATNQLWIWTIEDVSQGASLALTFLGIVWLLVQMVSFFMKKGK